MYLVHLRLRRTDASPVCALPEQIGAGVRAAARVEDCVEHVVVHGDARADLVLGVYVVADRIEDAEASAARVCRRALTSRPSLGGWVLIETRTPLIASFYEGFLDT
jgi:hypothetical protein